VLTNDSDPDNDTLVIQSVSAPNQKGAALIQNGAIVYTPATGFVGTENFTYTIHDGHGATATGEVVVTVSAKEVGATTKRLFLPLVER
jgi:Bacterial Ig domain